MLVSEVINRCTHAEAGHGRGSLHTVKSVATPGHAATDLACVCVCGGGGGTRGRWSLETPSHTLQNFTRAQSKTKTSRPHSALHDSAPSPVQVFLTVGESDSGGTVLSLSHAQDVQGY